MKLQSVSSPAVDREPAATNRSDAQSVRLGPVPAVFDTSAASPATFQCSVGAAERDNGPLRGGGLPGGGPVLRSETKTKAEALLLDGWSAAAASAKVGIGKAVVCNIRWMIDIPSVPPLMSQEFRTNVLAWLNLGIPEAQIAHDMGVQPETVHAIAEAQREVSQIVGALRAPSDLELSSAILKRVGRAQLLPATRTKVKALLGDGWLRAAVADELGIRHRRVCLIGETMDRPVVRPLRLKAFRDEVVARLHTGVSDLQVARETGVQPETVRLIRLQYGNQNPENPIPDVRLHREAERPGTAPASAPARTAPRSPQPGTSTGGETQPVRGRPDSSSPVAKRRRVDEAPAVISGALISSIIKQAEAGLPPYQIANNLRLSEETVWHAEFLYLQSSLRPVDEQIRIERANLPPSPATNTPVSPEVEQAVIRELRGGVDRPDIARHLHLPEPQIQAIHGQLLDDEFAQLDMDAFRAMTGSSSGESPG